MGINGLIGNIVAKRMAKKISSSTIKEEDVSELLREIRVVLLDSDVNIFVVKKFINNIKQKVVGQVLLPNEKISDFILRVIKEELIEILGNKKQDVNTNKKQLKSWWLVCKVRVKQLVLQSWLTILKINLTKIHC